MKKHIREEKAKIRRDFSDSKEIKKKIEELYKKLGL